ncbi:unnamed protein product [Lymnaea stagnalis]|uniref:VWFA domain-containing protein n=1 Tax=Lymnaea stagnalis TaxID=6523 RepID=A0AAV2GYI2_LYMST
MDFGSDLIFLDEGNEVEEEEQQESEEEEERIYEAKNDYGPSHGVFVAGFECEIMEYDESGTETPVTFAGTEEKKLPKKKNINTNTISLTMSSLREPPEQVRCLSEMIKCDNPRCEAVFSDVDKCDDDMEWNCRFCGMRNRPCKRPLINTQDVLYVNDLEKKPNMDQVKEDHKIIFVVDTSGSMGRTMTVQRKSEILKEIVAKELEDYHKMMQQYGVQIDPNQQTNEVSWLQAVKAAIIEQMLLLKENHPHRFVGLITFSDVVTIHGDAWSLPIHLEGGQLQDYPELLRLGQQHGQLSPISACCRNIEERIRLLNADGQTALGPALVVAQGMASDSKGSKIIVCTDGIANIGIGNLENASADSDKFYENIISKGKSWGLSMSVLSFDNCQLSKLGKVAEETGGIVDLIKPTELGGRLQSELNRTTIATNAFIKFVVHKSMYIQVVNENEKESTYMHQIGNIQMDKKIPFCFASRLSNPSNQINQVPDQQLQLPQQKHHHQQPPQNYLNVSGAPIMIITGDQNVCPMHGIINRPGRNHSPLTITELPPDSNDSATGPLPITGPKQTDDGKSQIALMNQGRANKSADTQERDHLLGEMPLGGVQNLGANNFGNRDEKSNEPAPSTSSDQTSVKSCDEPIPSTSSDNVQAAASSPPMDTNELNGFPFQVQIYYQDMNGVEAWRVWTKVKPVTNNRKEAEASINYDITTTSFIQNSAKLLLSLHEHHKLTDLKVEAGKITDQIRSMTSQKKNMDNNLYRKLSEFSDLASEIANSRNGIITEETVSKLFKVQALRDVRG